jgi:hypothetical protein
VPEPTPIQLAILEKLARGTGEWILGYARRPRVAWVQRGKYLDTPVTSKTFWELKRQGWIEPIPYSQELIVPKATVYGITGLGMRLVAENKKDRAPA